MDHTLQQSLGSSKHRNHLLQTPARPWHRHLPGSALKWNKLSFKPSTPPKEQENFRLSGKSNPTCLEHGLCLTCIVSYNIYTWEVVQCSQLSDEVTVWTIQSTNHGRDMRFLSSLKCPDYLWGPLTLLFIWYRGVLSPDVKWPLCEADCSPPCSTKVKNECTPTLASSSTGLFRSPSGISKLDCATTKTDTAGRSTSIGRKSLQVSVLPYRCSICAPLVTWQMSIL